MKKVAIVEFFTLSKIGLGLLFLLCSPAHGQLAEGGQLFGDWVVHCDTQSRPDIECRMSQMAVVEETSEPLLRINIRFDSENSQPYVQFVLPLGISLHHTPVLTLDDKPAGDVPLDMCLQDGCYSTFPLSPEVLESFLSMHSGVLELHAGNGEPVVLPISGAGSRAAFNAMRTMANRLGRDAGT